jgi:hypothetical protein
MCLWKDSRDSWVNEPNESYTLKIIGNKLNWDD